MQSKYGAQSPILFYKNLGTSCEMYNQLNSDNDFLLIIATEFQLEMLHIFGRKKVCIDCTHGLNSYRYQLFTIMIVDEYGNGIPVSYCFSNRCDTYMMEIFLKAVKERLTYSIETEILMTDNDNIFINAWSEVMGPPQKQLLCSWHVNRNWLQHLNSIKNAEKRKLVSITLYKLRNESSEENFQIYIQNFLNFLLADEETKAFGIYFRDYYSKPHRFIKWAYAFRQHTAIDCNMYLESLHKEIKHCYLKGTKCRRMDKAIDVLMTDTRQNFFSTH